MWSKGMLLCILIVYCNAVVEETSRFLNENGFGNLEPTFLVEEIEVRQIPRMPDNLLVALGVRTIGARLRIRSAAGQWVQAQVCVVKTLFVFSTLLTKSVANFLLQQGGHGTDPDVEVEGAGGGGDRGEVDRGE